MGPQEQVDAPLFLIEAKLAKALANPWRNRILMELHLQPMSPKQFCARFGGDLTLIARYFRELKDWDFIEVAEELRGGKRRGAVEKVYRATQRIHFDTATWDGLPRYLRAECSGAILQSLIRRISQAVKNETFDAEPDRHLSWKAVSFDRQAWTEYVTRLDQVLTWIAELEAESAERLATAEGEAIPATVALLAFRSPVEPVEISNPSEPEQISDDPSIPPFLISAQMAKAIANPWRNRILTELHRRPMSPNQFAKECGGPELATTARYFRQLREWGYLEVVEELRGGKRRGGIEKIYRAVPRAPFDMSMWESVPSRLREGSSGNTLNHLIRRINQAITSETFDADTDRHLSWKAIWLDRQAWTDYVIRLDEIESWTNELESEAAERLTEKGQEPIPITVGLMAFRAPDRRNHD